MRDLAPIFVLLAILIIIASVLWYSARVESSVFNRLTGNEVTQWEALWINLRVDCN